MWTFLLILLLVFAAVDLLVKFVIDPLASKKWSKHRNIQTKEASIEHTIGLVGATMYDGGKESKTEKPDKGTETVAPKEGNNSEK